MHDIFAFSDIHGMYDLYNAIMNYCIEQDPECSIIYLGDACDRGPAGYRIMKELLDNPYVVYLKGNHEDLFCKAAREIKEQFDFTGKAPERIRTILNSCRTFDEKYFPIQDALYNGGMDTLMDWITDGMSMEFVDRIEHLPLTFSTDTCDFCHAGGTPQVFMRVADAEYYDKPIDSYDATAVVWNRTGLNYGWMANRTCVFGHTPVPYVLHEFGIKWPEEKDVQPYKYYGSFGKEEGFIGAKIDMDTGACFLGDAWVLNCLTMRAQGFRDTDIKNEEIRKHDVEKIDVIQL